MSDFIALSSCSYVFEAPARAFVITNKDDNEALLIDSGNDKSAAKKIYNFLLEKNLKLVAILNTHLHADHIGGNAYLQSKFNCISYASKSEVAFINYPILEPAILCGTNPTLRLCNKFLMAAKSVCESIDDHKAKELLEKFNLSIVNLCGHTFDEIGFILNDDKKVVFLADSLFSKALIDKFAVPYIFDIKAYFKTLDDINLLDGDVFATSHIQALDKEQFKNTILFNKEYVQKLILDIKNYLKDPLTIEGLISKLSSGFKIRFMYESYFLIRTTVLAIVNYLIDANEVAILCEDNFVKYQVK